MCVLFPPLFLSHVLSCFPSPGLLALSSSVLLLYMELLSDQTPRAPLFIPASLSVRHPRPVAEVLLYGVENANSDSQHGLRNENLYLVLYEVDYERLHVSVRGH